MKSVSEILRDCAFALPACESTHSKVAALGGKTLPYTSPFICDYLEFNTTDRHALKAKHFLHDLGMGTGIAEFDFRDCIGDATLKTQYQRCMWLFFAADLWDEGFRP